MLRWIIGTLLALIAAVSITTPGCVDVGGEGSGDDAPLIDVDTDDDDAT